MERKEFQLNEVIFKETVYQNWMYSICEGSVDIYSGYGTADEKKLITLTKGQFFGEIGMIAVMPRTATAVAAENRVVLEQICHADLEDYLKSHPEHLLPIMRSVSARTRELTEDLSAITKAANESTSKNTGWLEGFIGKLVAKKAAMDESAVLSKRQQALAVGNPPLLRLRAGDVIFRAGEEADCMYDIYDGQVGIYSDYRMENEKLLATRYTEEVFGEMGILDDMPRSATAVCLTDCVFLVVKPENFMHFFQEKPAKILQILQQMCIQLRDLSQNYLQVCKKLQ
jgi:CRP-like cAMP-binding protein